MATLHKVTEVTNKILIGFVIGIGSIIFFLLLFRLVATIKESIFPSPPPAPTVSFGKLPPVTFPQNSTNKNFTFTLSTISGNLPVFPTQIAVYKMQKSQPDFLAFNKAQDIMTKNSFTSSPVKVSDTKYSWSQTTAPFVSITYDILNNNFSLSSQFLTNQDILSAKNLGNEQDAITAVKIFLTNLSLLPADVDFSKTQTSLFSVQNGVLTTASSLSDANIIAVDLFQKNVNSFPIYYAHTPQSIMHLLVGSSPTGPQVVGGTFTHNVVDANHNATYAIKTSSQAFNELKNNTAYIVNYDGNSLNVTITNVSLGYYMSSDTQNYLMPIIIFQGENNFYAFVQAVTNEWLQE